MAWRRTEREVSHETTGLDIVSAIRGLTGNFDIVTGLNATRVGADAVSEEEVGKCLYPWIGDSFALRRIAEEGT